MDFKFLINKKIGIFCNHTAVSRNDNHILDLIGKNPNIFVNYQGNVYLHILRNNDITITVYDIWLYYKKFHLLSSGQKFPNGIFRNCQSAN